MGVTIDQPDLARALGRLKPATWRRSDPVKLETVDGGELCMSADSSQLRVSTLCDTASGDLDPITIPYNILAKVASVTRKTGTVRFLHVGPKDGVRIITREGIMTLPHSDMQVLNLDPTVKGCIPLVSYSRARPPVTTTWKMPEAALEAIRAVYPSASHDDARPILSLIQLSPDGTVAATNSYTLAVRHLPEGTLPPEELLLPSTVLQAVPGETCEAIVTTGDRYLEVACDSGTTITSDPSNWAWASSPQFPNWRGLVPRLDRCALVLQFDRDALLDGVTLAARWSNQGADPMRLWWDGGQVGTWIKDWEDGVWEGVIPAMVPDDKQAADVRTAFNPSYFATGVRAIPSPVVLVGITDALKPALVCDPEGLHEFVIMPVRTS